ncbi:MAG TPA: hypothetical protein VJN91_04395 [Gammaproteobacteria bacterium]|nr:hypothetical protein [Gammaproteobacteria bacterium]
MQMLSVTSWLCLAFALYTPQAYALENIRLDLGRVETEYFTLTDLVAEIAWQADDHVSLLLRGDLVQTNPSATKTPIAIECQTAEWRDGGLNCAEGVLELGHQDGAPTRMKVEFALGLGADRHWEFKSEDIALDLALLAGGLRTVPESTGAGALTGGMFNGAVQVKGDGAQLMGISLDGDLTDLSLSADSILEHVDAALILNAELVNETWRLAATMKLKAGAVYLVSPREVLGDRPGFYIEPGADPIVVDLDVAWDPGRDQFLIRHFFYSHPGVLQAAFSAEVGLDPEPAISSLQLALSAPALEQAYPVYLQPLLLRTSINNLELVGDLETGIHWRKGAMDEAWLRVGDLHLADARKRFAIYGLHGDLRVRGDETPVRSTLGWAGLSFYRLNLGAGDMAFMSIGDQIEVVEWHDMPILDGVFHVEDFQIRNFGKPGFSLMLDGHLAPVSLREFSQAMGWPVMSGTLAGEFKGLHYRHGALELNGDLNIGAFGGDITLRDLTITGLFSQYSVLQGDIDFERLDLEQLTQTFTFGKIEGTLAGAVSDLVLEDWRPVSFEAQFATVADERPHRISRRALENLNQLGGGLSGTMSRGFLSLFPEYSYGQLGISCYLHGGVCELGGIRAVEGGSYLLTRGGLLPPWVEVRARGRSISWDELVDGLKQISQGGFEIR